MNLPCRIFRVNRASVGVVCWGVIDIVKRFARYCDDVRVNDLENPI